MVSSLVLCQQDKVVTAAVHNPVASRFRIQLFNIFVLVIQCPSGAVGLRADNGFKKLAFQLLDFVFRLLLLLRGGAVILQHRLLFLYLVFHLAVFLLYGVHKVLDAEHVAMVGKCHCVHTVFLGFLNQVANLRHAVKHRIVRVNVQVCKVHNSMEGFICYTKLQIYEKKTEQLKVKTKNNEQNAKMLKHQELHPKISPTNNPSGQQTTAHRITA